MKSVQPYTGANAHRRRAVQRVLLLTSNNILSAAMGALCPLAGLDLDVKDQYSIGPVDDLDTAAAALVVDASFTSHAGTAFLLEFMPRLTTTTYVLHDDESAVRRLSTITRAPLIWWPSDCGVLTLFSNLALLPVVHATRTSQPITSTTLGPCLDELTERERQVLVHLKGGLTYKEIALGLGIGLSTVKVHIANVKAKWQVTRQSEVVSTYIRLLALDKSTA